MSNIHTSIVFCSSPSFLWDQFLLEHLLYHKYASFAPVDGINFSIKEFNSKEFKITIRTSSVSAALFKSIIPSSAFFRRLTNFFVKRPELFNRKVSLVPNIVRQMVKKRRSLVITNKEIGRFWGWRRKKKEMKQELLIT